MRDDDANVEEEDDVYNFAYLDEDTKQMVRRTVLKAVAIPGYQVPFGSREIPLPHGWGTGGMQLTASLLGAGDVLKVIDQGADDTTNAVSIRRFFKRTTAIRTTRSTKDATMIQTRHRIPERPLREDQILVFQVPSPEPMRALVRTEAETRTLHATGDYSILYLKLYEDIVRFGQVATAYNHPVMVNGRYVAAPSPIPKFDNPKLHRNRALLVFSAGRENRIYAIPPYTDVKSLELEDYPFTIEPSEARCCLCGSTESFLDERTNEQGDRILTCSDTSYCQETQDAARSAAGTAGGAATDSIA
ncbi:MAG: alpha-D-ribose 1-methylphosphonate 5-phosphate C-P-lyase PhnJ [Alphaproteobacteria bacterium]|nr:alpha-D-ribose 1-methylphosphonate 5-phosphate C-P-lyase PhnJ [Alphaproteobacteria bacterium]